MKGKERVKRMSEQQHRLVIAGSMDEFIALAQTAKKRGYYVIVCDGYPDGPAKKDRG